MKISIVTPTFNSEKTIEDTIKSILAQDFREFEHIIIDNRSSDKTLEIIKKYEKAYKGRLTIVSEKDKGLFDAMNKGVKKSSGDIIGILNSDDALKDKHVLTKIYNVFKEKKCDIVFGDLVFTENDLKKLNRVWKAKIGNIKLGWIPPHPTLYLSKKVYEKIGYFDLKYKRTSDLDFMYRVFSDKSFKIQYIPEILVLMRAGGESTDGLTGYYKNFKESLKIYRNHNVKCALLVNIGRTMKIIFQMILAKTYNPLNKR